MAEVVVTGASDDLIEIDGAISEEFYYHESEDNLLAFSDGTILRVIYDTDGMWRISPIMQGSAEYHLKQGINADDDYSDEATLTGDIAWVVFGTGWAK